jgi:hypothetical protein
MTGAGHERDRDGHDRDRASRIPIFRVHINRLNTLGYFKPINGARDVDLHETPGEENRVDVNVRFQDR